MERTLELTQLQALAALDLTKCHTMGQLAAAWDKCSVTARSLGEVANTLTSAIQEGNPPSIVYSEHPGSTIAQLLTKWADRGWCEIMDIDEYFSGREPKSDLVVFVGHYTRKHAVCIDTEPRRCIFINEHGICPRDHVQDGYFPDVVFSDPAYIIPLLDAVLSERLNDTPTTVSGFIENSYLYRGLAEEMRDACQTMLAMVKDKDCHVTLTLSGAMTVFQNSLVVCEMIDRGMVHAIISTGALMAHGLIAGEGLKHYKHNPSHDDELLANYHLNRVTDTLEPETNFDHIEETLREVLIQIPDGSVIGSYRLHHLIGSYLAERYPDQPSILKSACLKGVPVYVPAFIDSELGNDLFTFNMLQRKKGLKGITVNPEIDSLHRLEVRCGLQKTGIISVGGGVPRNNGQNDAVLEDLIAKRVGDWREPLKFSYGVRFAPDKVHFGHLGGCTYSENMSWGKMELDGMFAEVHACATITWPVAVKYVMENMS